MNPTDAARWGAVAAELDDPFADADAVLARHSLTESKWRSLHRELSQAAATDEPLRSAFQQGYARARRPAASPLVAEPEMKPVEPTTTPDDGSAVPPRPPSTVVPTYLRPSRLLRRQAEPPAAPSPRPTQALPSPFETEDLPPRPGSAPLPFAPGRPNAPTVVITEADGAASTGTLALPEGIDLGESLPFHEPAIKPEEVDLSMFPLERYAAVTAALAAGEDRKAVLRRHVLTEVMWRALATAWADRIGRDPTLRARFGELVKASRMGAT